jgi:hypothetical protein
MRESERAPVVSAFYSRIPSQAHLPWTKLYRLIDTNTRPFPDIPRTIQHVHEFCSYHKHQLVCDSVASDLTVMQCDCWSH